MESWYRKPGPTTQGLVDLWRTIAPTRPKMIVEIGCADGGSASIWAHYATDAQIVCIDPWIEGTGYGEDVFQAFKIRTQQYHNVAYWRVMAEDAVSHFPPASIDFLYLDAVHTYEAMKRYFRQWRECVKDGGWIGGHDYAPEFPGVVTAVKEEWPTMMCMPQFFCDTSFLLRKSGLDLR